MLRLFQIAVALFMAVEVAAFATSYISPALEEIHVALNPEGQ